MNNLQKTQGRILMTKISARPNAVTILEAFRKFQGIIGWESSKYRLPFSSQKFLRNIIK